MSEHEVHDRPHDIADRADFRGRGPRGYERPSERIREDVCESLTDSPEVDASDIEVEVDGGIVTLRGSVADRRQKRLAEDLAESARGVRDVRNQLELERALADDLAPRVGAAAASGDEWGGGARGADSLGEYRDERWQSIDLRGFAVEARDGEIGDVDGRTEVGGDHLVVDIGSWIRGKKVVLPVGLIEDVEVDERRVRVGRTKDEIENAPELDEERYADPSYADELRAYYGGGGREEPVR